MKEILLLNVSKGPAKVVKVRIMVDCSIGVGAARLELFCAIARARPYLHSRRAPGTSARMHAEEDLETTLLGPVLPDRRCGDCTVCCTILTVDTPDFKKPGGTHCTHLTEQGCSIHAVRPHICRTWFCGWRRMTELPDEARPDRSGILVSLDFVREPRNCFEGVSIMVRLLPGSKAIENGMAGTILDGVCDELVPVWFTDGSKKMLMHPDKNVASFVLSGETAPAHLRAEVAAWRERYAAFATKR